ncbi:uncharacterized protein LOC109841712 [Asparagus officinalis]|uniref:uncharacterized protein LOC109841712 n=1 Tax=Asparagus officinalis TaxID=4686 RepID=UPI00098E253E|nr:uncharacterized protein LOC109841712 [Asparagus officinalis]
MSGVPAKESTGSTTIPVAPVKDRRNSGDIGWEFGFCQDPKNLNIVQCRLCGHKVNAGIHRFKKHLAGLRWDTKSCFKISEKDKHRVKEVIDANSKKKQAKKRHTIDLEEELHTTRPCDEERDEDEIISPSTCDESSKRSREPTVGPMDAFTTSDPELAKRLKGKMKQTGVKNSFLKEKRDWVHDQLATWAYENAILFHAISTYSFMKACTTIGDYGPSHRPPSMYMLREPLLRRAVERTKVSLKTHEEEWGKTGCSIMIDAWSDRKMQSIGADKIIQVVTDNAAANMAANELLYRARPRIFWTSCAAHTVDLMLESIGKLSLFKGAIEKARTLTIFIYSRHKTLSIMRRICDKRDIVRPGVTRFATTFLTLRSLLEKKGKLRFILSDEAWVRCKLAKTTKGAKVEAIAMSDSWWTAVAKILKVYAPIFRLLRVVDSDYKPSMGFVVGMLEDMKKEIIQVFKNKEKDFKPVIDIIDGKSKDRLFSPLHMASYYLNPYYFYRDDVVKNYKRAKDGFLDVVELFYPDVEQ